jgi:hypothetical protein
MSQLNSHYLREVWEKKKKKTIPAQLTMVQGGPKLFLTEEVEETQEVGGGFD